MGKMKELLIDMMEQQQNIKTYPLSSIIDDELTSNDLEEAHYVHTLNDIVLFMKDYGYIKVLEDIREHYNKSFKVEVLE